MKRISVLLLATMLFLAGCEPATPGNQSNQSSSSSRPAQVHGIKSPIRRNGVIFKDGKLLMLNGQALGGPLKLADKTVVELSGKVTYPDGRTVQMKNGEAIDLKGRIYPNAEAMQK